MNKSQRKAAKSWRTTIEKAIRPLRKGMCVSLMCGIKGVTVLAYVFTPGEPRRDRKEAVKAIAKLFARVDPELVEIISWSDYPKNLYLGNPNVRIAYAPHDLWLKIVSHPKMEQKGRRTGFLFDEYRGDERSFRAALAVLLRAKLIVVTENAFVWRRDVALRQINTGCDVTAKEIYK
jgi:hypothetical protein